MEKVKLLVTEKYHLNIDINRNKYHFLAFLSYQDSNARIKNYGLSIKKSSSGRGVSIKFLMEDFNFVVFEEIWALKPKICEY